MRQEIARLLRAAAQRLDPQPPGPEPLPAWPLMSYCDNGTNVAGNYAKSTVTCTWNWTGS
jgi:hypothetical protein